MCPPGGQAEGEGLWQQLDTCFTATFGPSFILGQPWVIKNQDLFLTKHSSWNFKGQPPEFFYPSCLSSLIFNRIPTISEKFSVYINELELRNDWRLITLVFVASKSVSGIETGVNWMFSLKCLKHWLILSRTSFWKVENNALLFQRFLLQGLMVFLHTSCSRLNFLWMPIIESCIEGPW